MDKILRKLFEQYAKRLLTGKVRPSISEEGIMTIPNNKRVQLMAENLYKDFKKAGVPDNILKTENDIKVFHHKVAEFNNAELERKLGTFEDVFAPKKSADVFDLKGNRIKNTNNIMGGEEIPTGIKTLNSVPEKKGMSGYEYEIKNPKKLDPALYEDRGENIIPAQFKDATVSPERVSQGFSTQMKLNNAETNKLLAQDLLQGKSSEFNNLTKEAKEDIITKINIEIKKEPDKFYQGGRAGFLVGGSAGKAVTTGIIKLVNKFIQMSGRKPTSAELRKIQNETIQKYIDFEQSTNKAQGMSRFNTNESLDNAIQGVSDFKFPVREIDQEKILKFINKTPEEFADGGRAGLYQGGQAEIEPDLSNIGHGSDALMARNMLIAPGSQATTSTGLNYLLGEDNDTTRVPYNEGSKVEGPDPRVLELMLNEKMSYPEALKEIENRMKQQPYIDERYNMGPGPILEAAEGGRIGYKDAGPVVLPQPKPAADPMVELQRIYNLYQESMPGVSQETQKYLQQDFIQKLNEANISQEQFMTNQMQNNFAEGGPARQNFGMGKRAFLKLIGSGVAGIAGLKTGLLGFGKKEVAKKAATELATSGGGTVPPYFFNLVKKIKNLGDDVTETAALAERQNVKQYKDFTLTEDTATGRIEIQKVKNAPGEEFGKDNFGNGLTEETYMSYTPGETIIGKGNKPIKTKPEYEEGRALLRNDRGNKGKIVEEIEGVSDDVIKEGTIFEDTLSEFGKADGGRIGYKLGKKVVETVIKKAGEGKFTKNEVLLNMFQNTIKGTKDANTKTRFINFIEEIKLKPELSKDPNVWNFFTKGLPKNQKLVVYGDDTVDFWTQSDFGPHNIATSAKFQKKHPYLTKDQAVKIQNMEPEDQIFEMKRLEAIRKRTANASGGRIGFSAGKGIMAIVKNLLKPKAKLSYLEKYPRIDIKELMKGDKPIKLYSGVGDRQGNTLKAYKETAKDFNTTVDKVKKDNFKGQWWTPFKEYASSFGNARNINSKMLTTELTPREIKMALRYVEKINKKDKMISRMKMEKINNPPKYNLTTNENTVIIPKIKLKKLKKAGKIDTDYMILDKMKNKLGLAEGGIAGMLGE
jgi:hypothetical protein